MANLYPTPGRDVLRFVTRWMLPGILFVAGAVGAAERDVAIAAPATVAAGSALIINLTAKTDLHDGEQIGFMHAEYSTDGGKTWTGICYDQNLGASVLRAANFPAGAAGTKVMVRVRVAFRGGQAGDVDYRGAALKWTESWAKWEAPPAKQMIIRVVAP